MSSLSHGHRPGLTRSSKSGSWKGHRRGVASDTQPLRAAAAAAAGPWAPGRETNLTRRRGLRPSPAARTRNQTILLLLLLLRPQSSLARKYYYVASPSPSHGQRDCHGRAAARARSKLKPQAGAILATAWFLSAGPGQGGLSRCPPQAAVVPPVPASDSDARTWYENGRVSTSVIPAK